MPCADDLECGIGEDCIGGECAFTGCVSDADCPTGLCRMETFSCAECGYASTNRKNFRRTDDGAAHTCSTGHYTDKSGELKRQKNTYARS